MNDADDVLPQPLVPGDVDLRDFPFLPLEGRRFLTSDTWLLGNDDERCAVLCLLIESWHQVPAASLPIDDRALAQLSQAGRRWPRVKAHALRGWVRCSDGRLYNPVLAVKALDAWIRKQAQRDRTRAATAAAAARKQHDRRALPRADRDGTRDDARNDDRDGLRDVIRDGNRNGDNDPIRNGLQGTGTGTVDSRQGKEKREGTLNPDRSARGARLPSDWQLPDEWEAWALQEREDLTPEKMPAIADTFRDYWISQPGAKGIKADWFATWRVWVRRDKKFNGSGAAKPDYSDLKRRLQDEEERDEYASPHRP